MNIKTFTFNSTVVCSPAYGCSFVKKQDAICNFLRGRDWKHEPSGRYMSIRDCAPGTIVELRYGKALQKGTTYTILKHDHSRTSDDIKPEMFASLQNSPACNALSTIDNPRDLTVLNTRHLCKAWAITKADLEQWVKQNKISSICAELVIKLKLTV